MGQFVVVEDRCHEAVVPAPLVPIELDCLAYTGSPKYPRIPHQCHFGHPPSVISSAARNLRQKTKISQSQPLTFVRGRLLRNDNGWMPSQTKKVFRTSRTHGVAVGYHNTAPQERGSKPRSPQRGVEWFCRGERLLALLPRDVLHCARFVMARIPNPCHFERSEKSSSENQDFSVAASHRRSRPAPAK